MSRLTSAEVISLGQYLEPDFNPSSLTVSQLLGVLGYHNVPYPTPYSKPKLIQVFNDEIKARATKFKKERLKKNNSKPSDDGITDGVTGKPLSSGQQKPHPQATPRRSSRRISQTPIEVEDSPPELPKRRRTSAQPGTSRRRAAPVIVPSLTEESEPEDEPVPPPPPPKKVGRSKKSSVVPVAVESPRIPELELGEDSGWEDNNIFQSGAESSSPARPSPIRRAPRKSGLTRVKKDRTSMSAPPQIDSSPTQSPAHFPPPPDLFKPPSRHIPLPPPKFSPSPVQRPIRLPSVQPEDTSVDELNIVPQLQEASRRTRSPSLKPEEADEEEMRFFQDDHNNDNGPIYEEQEEEQEEAEVEEEEAEGQYDEEEEDNALAFAMEAQDKEGPSRALIQHSPRSSILTFLYQLATVVSVAALALSAYSYKTESASIGFCDPGKNTNNALEALRSYRKASEVCHLENRTTLYLPSLRSPEGNGEEAPCPLPPLVPLPRPDACTPCPKHGTCTQFGVQCETGYLLRPNAFLFFMPPPPTSFNQSFSWSLSPSEIAWAAVSHAMNGLPGFGSVALPPRCVEDRRRRKNIGVVGKIMEWYLAQERGRRLCDGIDKEYKEEDGGEARRWGLEISELNQITRRKTTSPKLKETFDATFEQAIKELKEWGGVIVQSDSEGREYLASKEASLSWVCMLVVKSREAWAAWRTTAIGGAVALVLVMLARVRVAQKQIEGRRVAELVQIALDALRNQELAHHTDPVVTPQPYLSSIQLRDVILQNEHSIPARRRLWDQVEHIVEGNANVRANLEEIEGGDELRVWRWVGSTGRGLM